MIYANNLPLAHNTDNAFYVQDTWHTTPKLTLTLGLRYEFIGYPTSPQKGGIANVNFANANTYISNYGNTSATANVDQNYHDFGPRLGFAWSAFKNMVIRGGYTRSYTNGFFGANFGAITNTWPNATRQTISPTGDQYQPTLTLAVGPPSFISGFEILKAAGNPGEYPTPNSAVFGVFKRNPTNSVDEWNFTVQRQLPYDIAVSAAYVGTANRHIFYRYDANAAPPGPGPIAARQPYAKFGFTTNAYNQENQTSSGYESLQFQVQKRYSHGMVLTSAFTYSGSYDFGTHNAYDPFLTNLDRGPEDANRKLVFVTSHVWEIPVGEGRKFLNKPGIVNEVVGGWQLSGIWTLESGQPFTPFLGNAASLNSNCCTLRPNLVGRAGVSNQNKNNWFNSAAYAIPGLYEFGNAGRNSLWGPGLFHVDLSLQKNFKITERTSFEIQWEAFNAFNHLNLGQPNGQVDSSTAGMIFSTPDIQRRMQLGGTLRF